MNNALDEYYEGRDFLDKIKKIDESLRAKLNRLYCKTDHTTGRVEFLEKEAFLRQVAKYEDLLSRLGNLRRAWGNRKMAENRQRAEMQYRLSKRIY